MGGKNYDMDRLGLWWDNRMIDSSECSNPQVAKAPPLTPQPIQQDADSNPTADYGTPKPSTPEIKPFPLMGMTRSHCFATPSDWGTPGPSIQSPRHNSRGQPIMEATTHSNAGLWQPFPWSPWCPWDSSWSGTWQPQQSTLPVGLEVEQKSVAAKAGGRSAEANPPLTAAGRGRQRVSHPVASAARSHTHLQTQNHPLANQPSGPTSTNNGVVTSSKPVDGNGEMVGTDVPMLRLRGLPFSVSVQDVLAFFAQHDVADLIEDGPNAARLLQKANGCPSGQAVVQMRSRQEADIAQHVLHKKYISDRYIEVFVYGDANEAQDLELRSLELSLGGKAPPSATSTGAAGVPGPLDVRSSWCGNACKHSEWLESPWGGELTLPAGLEDVPTPIEKPAPTYDSWSASLKSLCNEQMPAEQFRSSIAAPVSLGSVSTPGGVTTALETPPTSTGANTPSRATLQV